jgi:hypothetical protein
MTPTASPMRSVSNVPIEGHFTPTGASTYPDIVRNPVLLADGRVFLLNYPGAVVYDPSTGTFDAVGDPSEVHPYESVTTLADGRVLLAGGIAEDPSGTGDVPPNGSDAEVFDPGTGTFTKTGSMSVGRRGQVTALLPDGTVLIAGGGVEHGGSSQGYWIDMLDSAEIYDPTIGTFAPTGSLTTPRDEATATRLEDGRVLVVGGGDEGNGALRTAEIYDPATRRFSPTGSMAVPRYAHQALLLKDGRVLIVGGTDGRGMLSSMEIYDPATGTFGAAGDPGVTASAVGPLPDGRVLLLGGFDLAQVERQIQAGRKDFADTTGCLLYDPATGQFTPAASMHGPDGVGLVLADGRVLVLDDIAELFSL